MPLHISTMYKSRYFINSISLFDKDGPQLKLSPSTNITIHHVLAILVLYDQTCVQTVKNTRNNACHNITRYILI